MKQLIAIFAVSFLVFSEVQSNFLANTAFDGVISLFRSSLDPLPIDDKVYTVKYPLFLSYQMGSLSFTNTSLTGLQNLSRIGDIDVSFDEESITGLISLGVPNVTLTSTIKPSLGHLLRLGYPLPAKLTIDYMEMNFTAVTDTWGGNPKLAKLKIDKFHNVKIDIDYGLLVRPFGYVANRVLNRSIMRLANGALRRRLEKVIKANINESLKDYSLFG